MDITAKRKTATAILLSVLTTLAGTGHAAAARGLDLRVVDGLFAMTSSVRILYPDDGVEVSGQVLKRPADVSRRLYDRIRLQILDASGRMLVERETRPRRVGLGRHTYRGRFDFSLDELPEDAAVLQVGYF